MRRVPDHQDGARGEDAEHGLQEARLVFVVEMRRGFVEQQQGTSAKEFAREGEA